MLIEAFWTSLGQGAPLRLFSEPLAMHLDAVLSDHTKCHWALQVSPNDVHLMLNNAKLSEDLQCAESVHLLGVFFNA